jgi:hypothetical protein
MQLVDNVSRRLGGHRGPAGAGDIINQTRVANPALVEVSNNPPLIVPENQICKQGARLCALRQTVVLRCQSSESVRDYRRKSKEPAPDVEHDRTLDRWKELPDVNCYQSPRLDMPLGISLLSPRGDTISNAALQVHWVNDLVQNQTLNPSMNAFQNTERVPADAGTSVVLRDLFADPVPLVCRFCDVLKFLDGMLQHAC